MVLRHIIRLIMTTLRLTSVPNCHSGADCIPPAEGGAKGQITQYSGYNRSVGHGGEACVAEAREIDPYVIYWCCYVLLMFFLSLYIELNK